MFLFLTRTVLLVLGLLVQDCLAEQICVRAQYATPYTRSVRKHNGVAKEENLANLFKDCEIVLLQWPNCQNRSNDDKILTQVNSNPRDYGGEFIAYDLSVSMPNAHSESILYYRNDAFKHVIAREHNLEFTKTLVVDVYPRHNEEDQYKNDYFMLTIFMYSGTGHAIVQYMHEFTRLVNTYLSEVGMRVPEAVIGHYPTNFADTLLNNSLGRAAVHATSGVKPVGCRAVLFNTMTTANFTLLAKNFFGLTTFDSKPIQLILDTDELFLHGTEALPPPPTTAPGPSHMIKHLQSVPAQTLVHHRLVPQEGIHHDGDAGERLGSDHNQHHDRPHHHQHGQNYNQHHDQHRGQSYNQPYEQHHGQHHDQPHNQPHNQHHDQPHNQHHGQHHDQPHNQHHNQHHDQLYEQHHDQPHNQHHDHDAGQPHQHHGQPNVDHGQPRSSRSHEVHYHDGDVRPGALIEPHHRFGSATYAGISPVLPSAGAGAVHDIRPIVILSGGESVVPFDEGRSGWNSRLQPPSARSNHNEDAGGGAVTGQPMSRIPSRAQSRPGRILPYASTSNTGRGGPFHTVGGRDGNHGDDGRRNRSPQGWSGAASGARDEGGAMRAPRQHWIHSPHPDGYQDGPLDLSTRPTSRDPEQRRDNDPTPPAEPPETRNIWRPF